MSAVTDPLDRTDVGCFDFDGNPISMREWSALNEDPARKRVALDHIGDVEISTIWIGIDLVAAHRRPRVYETAVFNADGHVIVLARYSTREEAIEGHKRALLAERHVGWFRIYPEEAE